MTISNESRDRVKGVFVPIALAMGRAGLTPDALTLIGFAITVIGAVLLSQQLWLLGGLVVFGGGVFDMFDGTLARATGRVSRLGAFMDSVFDRWGEAAVYLGLVVGFLGIWGGLYSEVGFELGVALAVATMGMAFMVSYARAKAEGLGFSPGTGMAAVGVMPREIRLVVLCLGLVLMGITGMARTSFPSSSVLGVLGFQIDLEAGYGYIALALLVILIGSTITVFQRILHVRHQAQHQSTSDATPPLGG